MPKLDLELYRLYIENLRKDGTDEIAQNSGYEHATICLENIFRSAQERVILFSGKLSSKVFNDDLLISALKEALNRRVKLDVLIQENKADEDSEAYKILKSESIFNPDRINIKTGLGKIAIEEKYDNPKKNQEIHFALADGKAYRIEQDTENRKARICFNDPETVENLTKVFEGVFVGAEVLS